MSLSPEIVGEFIDAVVDDEARARQLLSTYPELLNARWLHGETVLHFLAVEGFIDGVRRLAEWSADVNLVNDFGDPPLRDCVALGNEGLVELLLQHGANPNVVSDTLGPLLHAAVASGHAGIVRRLLVAGADVRACSDSGETVFDALPTDPDERDAVLAVLTESGVGPQAG